MSLDQYGFRWRNDDGSESSATWKATQNTNVSLPLDTPVRLRIGVDVSADPGPGDSYWRLEAKKTTAGNWFEVVPTPGANKAIVLSASGNIAASGEATSPQLTAPSGKTTANFANGRMWDDESGLDAVNLGNGKYTEFEWCVKADSGNGASTSDAYDFRITRKQSGVSIPGDYGTFLQSNQDYPGTVTGDTLAYLSNNNQGNILSLVARVGNAATNRITSVTDSANNSWFRRISRVVETDHDLEIWTAFNCAAGPNTITANLAGSYTFRYVIMEHKGNGGFTRFNAGEAAGNSGVGTSVDSSSITTTDSHTLFIAGGSLASDATTYTPTSGFVDEEETTDGRARGFDKVVTATGTYNFTANLGSSDTWGAAIVGISAGG